jgi:hypothetical protein
MSVAITNEVFVFQVALPAVGSLLCLLMAWSLDRTLSRGAERTPARSKLLSHGFLFVLGMSYLIAWNEAIARLIHFPGAAAWKPLTAVWGFLLFYDGWRRVEIQKMRAQAESTSADEPVPDTDPASQGWRLNVASALRLVAFFALVGAISMRRMLAFVVVALIVATIWLLERRRQPTAHVRRESR